MFRIGEFSKISQVPVSALRYYADIGLLKPEHIDNETGYRYYTFTQLPALNRILALKNLGLALNQISAIMQHGVSAEQIEGMLLLKQSELQQVVDETQSQIKLVQARLNQIYQEGKMPAYDIVTKSVDPIYALAIREVIPTPSHVGTLMGESFGAIARNGIEVVGAPFAIFHDMEFKADDLDVEIVFPVAPKVQSNIKLDENRELVVGELAGFELAATTIYIGEFENIPNAYSVIGQWIAENDYQIAGASREVYLRAPSETEPPMTEIQFPVKKG